MRDISLAGYSVYKNTNKQEANVLGSSFALNLKAKGSNATIALNPKVVSNKAYISSVFLYHDKNIWDYNYDEKNIIKFDRIIDFGTITGESIYKFILRNADIKEITIKGINFSQNDNVDIFGVEPNATLKPNEYVEITLRTDINGNAILNTDLIFTFSNGQSIIFALQGIRAVIWSYLPNLAYTESKELKTDIFTAQNGTEKRVSIRDKFIRSVKFKLTTKEIEQQTGIANLLIYAQKTSFFVPLWLSAVRVDTDYTNATISLSVSDTINSEFKNNGFVLVYSDFDKWEFIRLVSFSRKSVSTGDFNPKNGKFEKNRSVYKGTLTLEKGVRANKGDLVVPLMIATPKTAINSEFLTGKVGSYNLEFKELL